jgi:hypothetical protein
MRKPFLFFLLLITIYCWITDIVGFTFYLFNKTTSYQNILSAIIGGIVCIAGLYILKKTIYKNVSVDVKTLFQTGSKKEWLILLLVSAPIIWLGLLRSVYPDQNFDQFHFELYLQEFNFPENKTNFAPGNIRTYYFPLPERVFALSRHILGYRLGSLINTFLLVTILFSVYDFIKRIWATYKPGYTLPLYIPALLALFAVFADNALVIFGSYKPDLLGLPFLLELIHMLFLGGKYNKKINYILFFVIASLIITIKLTYLPYLAILGCAYFIINFNKQPKLFLFGTPFCILLFPAIYCTYNLIETGSPIFPFFNNLFHSPLYPNINFKDTRWGHRKTYEIFIFPVVTLLNKSRCNEWNLYSFRLLFGYIFSLAAIICYFIRRDKFKSDPLLLAIFYISIFAILSDYSCIITTGYYRYGIIIEVIYGIIIGLWLLYFKNKLLKILILGIMLFQAYDTYKNMYVEGINYSWHNYKNMNGSLLKNNAGRFFNDYNTIADSDKFIPAIDAFVSLEPIQLDGLAKLIKKNVPIYNISLDSRTPDSVKQFEKNVVTVQSTKQNLVVVANNDILDGGIINALNKRGYLVSEMHEVYPTFMRFNEPVYLLKINYLDTTAYQIQTQQHYLGVDTTQFGKNFIYRTQNNLKAFIREAPVTFASTDLSNEYDILINNRKYQTTNRFKNNKIFTVAGKEVDIHLSKKIPYLIIIQEIQEKR